MLSGLSPVRAPPIISYGPALRPIEALASETMAANEACEVGGVAVMRCGSDGGIRNYVLVTFYESHIPDRLPVLRGSVRD